MGSRGFSFQQQIRAKVPNSPSPVYQRVIFESGLVFEGHWINQAPQGQFLVMQHPSDLVYTGTLDEFEYHGFGVLSHSTNYLYEGEFTNGKRDGCGKEIIKNTLYIGQFHNNLREGSGKMSWEDGSWYEGSWKTDMYQGPGQLYDCSTNTTITAVFQFGLFAENLIIPGVVPPPRNLNI